MIGSSSPVLNNFDQARTSSAMDIIQHDASGNITPVLMSSNNSPAMKQNRAGYSQNFKVQSKLHEIRVTKNSLAIDTDNSPNISKNHRYIGQRNMPIADMKVKDNSEKKNKKKYV